MKPTFRSLLMLSFITLMTLPSAEAAKWPSLFGQSSKGRFSIVKEYSAAYSSSRPGKKKNKRTAKMAQKASSSRHRW